MNVSTLRSIGVATLIATGLSACQSTPTPIIARSDSTF